MLILYVRGVGVLGSENLQLGPLRVVGVGTEEEWK